MLKILLVSIMLCATTFGAEKSLEFAPEKPSLRYRHIQRPDGKILATIDLKENKTEYFVDAKEVVDFLVKVVLDLDSKLDAAAKSAKQAPLQKTVKTK